MSDELLFSKYELSAVIENHRAALLKELDGMADQRLLNTDLAELQRYALNKFQLEMIVLGEPSVDEGRTKMRVGRHGGIYGDGDRDRVTVDAQRYTLEVPFSGDRDLFFCQGPTFTFNPPRGLVGENLLSSTLIDREPTADQINSAFESFLKSMKQHLGWLKGPVEQWNASIGSVVAGHVQERRARADRAGTVAS